MTIFTASSASNSSSNSSHVILMSSSYLATSLPPSHTSLSTNETTQCTCEDPSLRVPLAIVYSLFFFFGLVGNLFALWVFLSLHSSHNSVRVFLINCAVADLVLLACLPFRIFYHINRNQWLLGSVACKMVGNLFYMNMYISITLLGFISLDRFLRLRGKSRVRRGMKLTLWGRSWPRSWVACGVLWGLSLILLIPMIAKSEDKEHSGKCFHFKMRSGKGKVKAYINAILVVAFWLIFFMLFVSYMKIALQLLRLSRDKPQLPNAHRYQQTAKKSFFVLFLFTVCFAPYHAFRPFYILSQLSENTSCDHLQMVDRTNEVMLLFSAFNSCLDPIMYFLLSGSVRKTALQVLGHRLGNRPLFRTDGMSNSSTTEFRRPSVLMTLPNTPSVTPRASICVINSTLRRQ